MNWIKRHKIIVFLIGIFVILGIILSLSYYFAGQNTFIGRSANKIVNAISKPFAVSTRFVENKKTDIADILSLKEDRLPAGGALFCRSREIGRASCRERV